MRTCLGALVTDFLPFPRGVRGYSSCDFISMEKIRLFPHGLSVFTFLSHQGTNCDHSKKKSEGRRSLCLFNITRQVLLANYVEVAQSFKDRSVGLLGRQSLEKSHCLWIHRCRSIHTFFMKFNIDVLYVDGDLKITKIQRNIHPWNLSWGGLKSSSCFEFQGQSLPENLQQGDSLHVGS